MLVTRRLPRPAMDLVASRCEVTLFPGDGPMPRDALLRDVAGKRGAVVMLTDRIDEEFLEAAGPGLRIVANFAVGFDNVDVPTCTDRDVMVSNTPDVLTETTADMAWALMLAAARRVVEGDRLLRSGSRLTWGPETMLGIDVHDRVLGIVGFGRIGRAVARRATGFGMRVVYHDSRRHSEETENEFQAEYRGLAALLSEADFVTLHVSMREANRHLIDERAIRTMKPTAVLVNTSRGPVVDEEALALALAEHRIFAAGLDVFEREPEVHPMLLELDNVVLAPHLGSATVDTRHAMARLAAENLIAGVQGTRPPTLVNPKVWSVRPLPDR